MERLGDLTALLGSLVKQTYPHMEVIVVLEKSLELQDSVSDYARQNGYSNVRLLFNSGPLGASAARNLGIRQAAGIVLAFIDDDALASPGWLSGVIDTFERHGDIIGVTGPTLPVWENENLKWLPEEFYWIISCVPAGMDKPVEVRNAWGNNMSFRREAFEKGGLFLTLLGAKNCVSGNGRELAGEDTEFSFRARRISGKRIVWSPEAVVYHRARAYRFSSGFIARRAYLEGHTKILLKKALGRRQPDILAVERKLLKGILYRLLPASLAGMASCPARSWRKLKLIAIALTGVAVGYTMGMFQKADELRDEACIEYL
jgi:GT2 family glycosyltransferase